MGIGNLGLSELMIVAVLVLLLFGPRRLPEIGRTVGRALREFKRGMNEVKRELEQMDLAGPSRDSDRRDGRDRRDGEGAPRGRVRPPGATRDPGSDDRAPDAGEEAADAGEDAPAPGRAGADHGGEGGAEAAESDGDADEGSGPSDPGPPAGPGERPEGDRR